MPKATRLTAPISVSTTSPKSSDDHPLWSIALFSGIGLLVSLIAVLMGVQGVWF